MVTLSDIALESFGSHKFYVVARMSRSMPRLQFQKSAKFVPGSLLPGSKKQQSVLVCMGGGEKTLAAIWNVEWFNPFGKQGYGSEN